MNATDPRRVAQVLREMASLLRAQGESVYKSRAYDRAADRIVATQTPLQELVDQKRLTELPGIGPSLAGAIEELVTTGTLRSHEKLKARFPPGLAALAEVPGLGPKKAMLLWQERGIGDLAALEKACREGQVRTVRGFGPRTEAQLLERLPEAQRPATPTRLRLSQALDVARPWLKRLLQVEGALRAEVTGSARRFAETVGNLDLVVSSHAPGRVLEAFVHDSNVASILELTAARASVKIFEPDLEVRLQVCAPEAFAAQWIFATGSADHLRGLESCAELRGYRLTETGLYKGERRVPAPTEASIYKRLGLELIPPELREGHGEFDPRERERTKALLPFDAIQGVVHSHSTWSDGNASLEEMALAARDAGFHYLTVTDHSQTAFYAGGMKEDALQRQWEEIDLLNEKLSGIQLLRGIESDIVAGGALDYPGRILDQLQVVVGSIHARHKMDEDQMTRRILSAMDDPHLHILGHLTGRLINTREPYRVRVDEIFEKAAARGIAIEVNGSPARLDLGADLVRRALAHGVKLVVSTDSHSTRELGNMFYAVGTARRGGATTPEVLNTLPVHRFLARLGPERNEETVGLTVPAAPAHP